MVKNKQLIIILFFLIITLAFITLAIVIAFGIYHLLTPNQVSIKPCTQEAKLCPDGSSVGRVGPNCEFAACPMENENKIYSVDELVKSNFNEGTEVLVKGKYGIELVSAGSDYEGPGGGSYLFGQIEKLQISFNGLPNTEINQVITVKGKVKYCGGKKIPKYLCALTDIKVIEETCKNLCGDGTCQEVVCMAIGCPCAETALSCPQDCAKESGQVNQVSIADILSNPDKYLNKKVRLEEKFCGWGQTTGSAGPLFTRSDWCVCQNPQEKERQSLTVTGAALPVNVSPTEKESMGKILSIIGIIKKTANNIPYIEASEIKK